MSTVSEGEFSWNWGILINISTTTQEKRPFRKNFGHLLLEKLQNCVLNTEAVARMCSVKKVFIEILQNSQKNICARVSF